MTDDDKLFIIPAQPGWQIAVFVEASDEENPAHFHYTAIIAWQIETGFYMRGDLKARWLTVKPISSYDPIVEDDDDTWLVRRPDHSFEEPDYCTNYETEAEAIEYIQQRLKRFREADDKVAPGKASPTVK